MDDPELRAAALEIRILAAQLAKLADRDLEERLDRRGRPLTALQYQVLRLLSNGPLTLSEVSRRMILTPTTLVPVVDALERKGLLERGRDPFDRRRLPLSLTRTGEQALADLAGEGTPRLVFGTLKAMGTQKAQALLELLREVVGHAAGSEMAATVEAVAKHVMSDLEERLNGAGSEVTP